MQGLEGRCSYCGKDIIEKNQEWKCTETRKTFVYKDKVLRQTEEANLIVASSYNAVVKWSLNNSLNPMKMQNSASEYKTNREFNLRVWC